MDQLDAIRTFVAVADHGSFVEAARIRRISPTAASRALAEMEERLGTLLLRRTTRSVQLTPEGATYLEHCRQALIELDDAAQTLRGDNAEPRGLLIVTAPVVFGRLRVLPVVLDLMRRHPGLTVQLTLTDRVVRLVDEGVDVAVRIAHLADSALRALRIDETRRVLVASPDYLARRGVPGDVVALRDHDLIAFDNFTQNGEWRFGPDGRQAVRVEPRLLTNSVDSAMDAAMAGGGILRALSYQVENHVVAGRLAYVLDQDDPPPVPISLVFQGNRARSPNVRRFVEAMREARPAL
ncbi:LysR family transcriptional regulator [Novosphingobium sediminicola]|uniref:DNA-binding transcriptional LysR family regulator n=1 Tax=Novosphingobium sediminicola TaxID=563162 RepID=A0A7W6CIR7_9SPHN|nr:LysR family transcriptional regulator [Novosphingobium sediminicola]MBB3957239.1 DNA-binding transcriptional LysR family regulator [Novosphingobium sediminicola]